MKSVTDPSVGPMSRVSGKMWKTAKKPTNRATMFLKGRTSWEERVAERTKHAATKALERDLKEQTATEKRVPPIYCL
jgi:hypothetical protein